MLLEEVVSKPDLYLRQNFISQGCLLQSHLWKMVWARVIVGTTHYGGAFLPTGPCCPEIFLTMCKEGDPMHYDLGKHHIGFLCTAVRYTKLRTSSSQWDTVFDFHFFINKHSSMLCQVLLIFLKRVLIHCKQAHEWWYYFYGNLYYVPSSKSLLFLEVTWNLYRLSHIQVPHTWLPCLALFSAMSEALW